LSITSAGSSSHRADAPGQTGDHFISALLAVAGACYLINSLAHFLYPATGAVLFNAGILVPCFVAELSLTLWLLVKGVNVAHWEERASQEVAGR
jgi:hypothetical protein